MIESARNHIDQLSQHANRILALSGSVLAMAGGLYAESEFGDNAQAQTPVTTTAETGPTDTVEVTRNADVGGGGSFDSTPAPAPGSTLQVRFSALGDADSASVGLLRHSRRLTLLKVGSKPAWNSKGAEPTWDMGRLTTQKSKEVDFKMHLSTLAKVGSKACATLRATGINGSGSSEKTDSFDQKMCVTVVKHK